jgi:opacity protein-like surface antigen
VVVSFVRQRFERMVAMCKKQIIFVGLLAAMVLASMAVADAAPRIRNVELSIAGSAQAFVEDGDASFLVNIPLRIGVFVSRNFEVEAESVTSVATGCSDDLVGYVASLNGSYNFPASDRLLPFILVGFGFANSAPIGNVFADFGCDGVKMSVFNAGFGWKFLFTRKAALRLEYRFQRFSGSETRYHLLYDGMYYDSVSYTDKFSFSMHSMFVGVSLFF